MSAPSVTIFDEVKQLFDEYSTSFAKEFCRAVTSHFRDVATGNIWLSAKSKYYAIGYIGSPKGRVFRQIVARVPTLSVVDNSVELSDVAELRQDIEQHRTLRLISVHVNYAWRDRLLHKMSDTIWLGDGEFKDCREQITTKFHFMSEFLGLSVNLDQRARIKMAMEEYFDRLSIAERLKRRDSDVWVGMRDGKYYRVGCFTPNHFQARTRPFVADSIERIQGTQYEYNSYSLLEAFKLPGMRQLIFTTGNYAEGFRVLRDELMSPEMGKIFDLHNAPTAANVVLDTKHSVQDVNAVQTAVDIAQPAAQAMQIYVPDVVEQAFSMGDYGDMLRAHINWAFPADDEQEATLWIHTPIGYYACAAKSKSQPTHLPLFSLTMPSSEANIIVDENYKPTRYELYTEIKALHEELSAGKGDKYVSYKTTKNDKQHNYQNHCDYYTIGDIAWKSRDKTLNIKYTVYKSETTSKST